MTDRERLTIIVAQTLVEARPMWTKPKWDELTEGERKVVIHMAEAVIKALQVHGYLNSRGYPPDVTVSEPQPGDTVYDEQPEVEIKP